MPSISFSVDAAGVFGLVASQQFPASFLFPLTMLSTICSLKEPLESQVEQAPCSVTG